MLYRALVAAVAVLCLSVPAFAEPPPEGWYGTIRGEFLFCIEQADMREVAAEFTADPGAGVELFVAKARKGVCTTITDPQVAVGEVFEVDNTNYGAGAMQAWVVHIGNAGGHGWIMYESALPGVDN